MIEFLLLIMFIIFLIIRKTKKCPNCGNGMNHKAYIGDGGGPVLDYNFYECPKCGEKIEDLV